MYSFTEIQEARRSEIFECQNKRKFALPIQSSTKILKFSTKGALNNEKICERILILWNIKIL